MRSTGEPTRVGIEESLAVASAVPLAVIVFLTKREREGDKIKRYTMQQCGHVFYLEN